MPLVLEGQILEFSGRLNPIFQWPSSPIHGGCLSPDVSTICRVDLTLVYALRKIAEHARNVVRGKALWGVAEVAS